MVEEGLLDALRAAPRRYRMPPLPRDAHAARAAGPEAALAFAIEQARRGHGDEAALRALFTESLAALIALGDPQLQATLLREDAPEVAEFVALQGREHADRRRVRADVDAVAHPGKLRGRPGEERRLAPLHALAHAGDWRRLQGAGFAGEALERLVRGEALRTSPDVQRYLALLAAQGPLAGSADAARRGRAAAHAGEAAEARILAAFAAIARALDPARYRALSRLRPAQALPGAAHRAKDEWDAALVRTEGGEVALVLLAESKAAPAAAAGDWPRLLRGLQRLAQVQHAHAFAADQGEVRVTGASLRALAPVDGGLPERVFYACIAQEAQVPLLSPAARALLLQQPASLACARGGGRNARLLDPLWDALPREPRLRPVLLQHETARRTREAMLHPGDLLAIAAR